MRWRSRGQGPTPSTTLARRAVVVPLETRNVLDNESNLSAATRVRTRIVVVLRPEGPDSPDERAQEVEASVPNWLRIVLEHAGSNLELSADLPPEIEVGVLVSTTGTVEAVDVDAAVRELDPYREVATRWWKETEAPLADLREITSLPGDAVRGVKGLAGTWRRAVADMRADVAGGGYAPAHGDQEREQLRRSSATVRHRLQANPKQLAKVRASALAAGPMMAENVRTGAMSVADLESWLTFQVGSGAVTEAEAAEWRAAAQGA